VRVIAGSARGRRLTAPKGLHTRPTPDRVREALFSILGPMIPGATILDLFAGTGAFGIEALSRGANRSVFVDNDRRARQFLEKNLAVVAGTQSRILPVAASQALKKLVDEGEHFDVAFLDPPFDAGLLEPTLWQLAASGIMAAESSVICEHRGRVHPPAAPNGWCLSRERPFGDVAVSIFVMKGHSP